MKKTKKTKKIISALLAIAMLSSVTCSVPLTASATSVNVAESSYTYEDYSDWTYELLENGEGYRVLHYNGDQSKVKIPNKINNLPVYEIGRSAFENNSNLISVIIPESVNIIAESAFLNCTNLSKVYYTGTQDNWHSVMLHIGNECITPEEVYFDTLVKNDESGVWVAEKINDDMCILVDYFGNANKVQIPSKIEDRRVIEIGEYVFADNSNLTKLIISNSIERISEYAFMNCTNLGMVYYTGSRENWQNAMIGLGNEALKSKEVYCDALVKNDESGVWVAHQMFEDTCIITEHFGNANKVQ
ncbi:MAG: leucine-rich repeat domain-containing protein, partial [Acutalibacteraceae bacterium]|nr:leucine-rich repeat domain-containing protein [Acutalibacteraceae bacterium]